MRCSKRSMHGLLLGLPLRAPAQNENSLPAWSRRDAHLQPLMHQLPVFGQQLPLEFAQRALRRPHDVAPAGSVAGKLNGARHGGVRTGEAHEWILHGSSCCGREAMAVRSGAFSSC